MNAYGTKVSKSRLGSPRFPKRDKPLELNYAETKMNKKQLKEYLETGKLPKEVEEKLKKKRGRPKMKPEQAQELEKVNLDDELTKLEQEVVELSQTNDNLKQELDDLIDRYNKLSLDYETAEQVRYDLTRAEGQRDQLRASLKETEEILFKEVDKRETLERLAKLYLP